MDSGDDGGEAITYSPADFEGGEHVPHSFLAGYKGAQLTSTC